METELTEQHLERPVFILPEEELLTEVHDATWVNQEGLVENEQ